MDSVTGYAHKITLLGVPGYEADVSQNWKRAYEGLSPGSPFLISINGGSSQLDHEEDDYGAVHIESSPVLLFAVKTLLSPLLIRPGEDVLVIPVQRFSKLVHGEILMKETTLRLSLADLGKNVTKGIFGSEAIKQWAMREAASTDEKKSSLFWSELVVNLVRMGAVVGYDFPFPEFIIAVKGQRSAECIKRLAAIATQKLTPELRIESHALIDELKRFGVSEDDCKKYIRLELGKMAASLDAPRNAM